MPRIASVSRAAWLAAFPLFVACGNEPTPPAPVASVEVSPDTAGVVLGRTLQLTARARDAQGHDLAERPVTWTSSAPTLASVSPNGLVTGLAPGDSIEILAMSEGKSDTAAITVVLDIAGEWNFTAEDHIRIPIGSSLVTEYTCSDTGSVQFTQSGTDLGVMGWQVGTCLGGHSLLAPVGSWDNSGATSYAARLSSTHLRLLGSPDCVWEADVTGPPTPSLIGGWSCPDGSHGSWEATPGGAPVSTVGVRWGVQTVAGGAVQLVVVPRDAAAHVLNRSVTWSSDNPSVTTVSDRGLVTVLAAGSVQITATSESIPGSATIRADLVNFSSMSAGGWHSCGVTTGGTTYCWGSGGDGQLGIGFRPPIFQTLASAETPLAVAGGRHFTQLSSGLFHSCGITATGEAYCWGVNESGQLGDGSYTSSLIPVAVTGGHQFASITAGYFHSCGVTTGHGVYCWGDNYLGQLADGSIEPMGSSASPVVITKRDPVLFQTVHAGLYHSCAVTTTLEAYCWGWNDAGQVGNGTTSWVVTTATLVAGGRNFVRVAAGYRHSCGTSPDGVAYCWGEGHLEPAPVAGGPFATANGALAAGASHTCALTPAGAAYCWGQNAYGQLGDGSTIDRATPVTVSGGLSFATISAENVHTCGVTTGAVAFCWGLNRDGRLGADATGSCANGWPCATAPVRVTGQPGAAAARSLRVDARPQADSRVPSVRLRASGRGLPPLAPSVHATRQ